eukprot:COSAG02_NODE_16014_length_1121_cov_0.651663_1_plen_266_part_00
MRVHAIFPLLPALGLLPASSLSGPNGQLAGQLAIRPAQSSRGLSHARAEHMITARSATKGKPEEGHFIFSQFMEDSQQVIAEMSKGKEGEFSLWYNDNGHHPSQRTLCTIAHDSVKDTPLYSMRATLPGDVVWSAQRGFTKRSRVSSTDEAMCLRTKMPVWNEEMQSYTLDYGGRARLASAKNFQLELSPSTSQALSNETQTEMEEFRNPSRRSRRGKGSRHGRRMEGVAMQFGKYDEDTFNLDFAHPLCGLQALAIALSTSEWR